MTATWGDLFERAAAYDASEDDVRRALAERREERAATDGTEPGRGSDAPKNDAPKSDAPKSDAPESDG